MKLQLLIALTVLAARATLIIPDLAKAQTSIESYNNAQSYHCCYGRVRQKFEFKRQKRLSISTRNIMK